jgi:hypothetical protein
MQVVKQTLAEILHFMVTAETALSIPQLIQRQAHWSSIMGAVQQDAALHSVARRTLHGWLVSSANVAAWDLAVWSLDGVRAACAADLQMGALPPALRGLYPPQVAGLARLMHTQRASSAGLVAAGAALRKAAAAAAAAAAATAGGISDEDEEGVKGVSERSGSVANDAINRSIEGGVWALLLDRPEWICTAAEHVGIDQLVMMAMSDAQQQGMSTDAAGGGGVVGNGSEALAAANACIEDDVRQGAALLLSWVLWPWQEAKRSIAYEALSWQHWDVELRSVASWLLLVQRWKGHWREKACGLEGGQTLADMVL